MKKSRYTDNQIISILKQAEAGALNRPGFRGGWLV